jgi:demethylmenaquinone methyltransferase/2-methoxy-6-polyprenyl-1,4-benzoquinol methylase
MPELYRDNAQKREWLRRIFDDTATDYDRVERWVSLGSGRWHRRQALARAGLSSGMRVADIACGTGLLAREAVSLVGPTGSVLGVDPSEGMLAEARRTLGIQTVSGVADALPLPPASFDFVSLGYALRHIEDLGAAFAEFFRVLSPGGRVCILEITRPSGRLGRTLLKGYLTIMSSSLLRLHPGAARTGELWKYYWQTIDQCVRPDRVTSALQAAGFEHILHRKVLGVFSEYVGQRPL